MRRAPSSRPSQCRCLADAGQPLLPVYRYTHLYAPQVNPAYLYTGVHTCTHITMLDIQGLPKNANGFRTTHTCELCGFEPKTKNKYREKQDHLVMKHFKERIDKIFPHCRPYSCPNKECEFAGTGKQGLLELFLREALEAKGIHYALSDSAKRKSMGNTDQSHRDGGMQREQKKGRLSPPIEETVLPQGSPECPVDTTTILPSEFPDLREPVNFQPSPGPITVSMAHTRIPTLSLPTQPTNKLPSMASVLRAPNPNNPTKAEVDAMLASFQPSDFQISSTVLPQNPQPCPSTSPPLNSQIVSSTSSLDFFLPTPEESSKLLLNDNIMWGGGNSGVTVESSVPVQYLETTEQGFVNLGDIDYDYLYPATVDPTNVQPMQTAGGEQRLLSFSML